MGAKFRAEASSFQGLRGGTSEARGAAPAHALGGHFQKRVGRRGRGATRCRATGEPLLKELFPRWRRARGLQDWHTGSSGYKDWRPTINTLKLLAGEVKSMDYIFAIIPFK